MRSYVINFQLIFLEFHGHCYCTKSVRTISQPWGNCTRHSDPTTCPVLQFHSRWQVKKFVNFSIFIQAFIFNQYTFKNHATIKKINALSTLHICTVICIHKSRVNFTLYQRYSLNCIKNLECTEIYIYVSKG